jgi:RNA-directed DNA polymerase
LGNLSTPNSVQKLQKALHAKAKAEAGYCFYALYDKISREDILAHAYGQCRSNIFPREQPMPEALATPQKAEIEK